MDDLLVGGSDDDGHLKNLEAVLCQFQKYGLRVKLPRCVFMAQSVIYFRFRFSEKGLQPGCEKVRAIKEAPAQTNFIPKLSTLAHPLPLGNKSWNWSPNCEKAFSDVKCALTSETVLTHYNPCLPVS